MGTSPTPPGLVERIMQMVDERIARFARSAFLRNAEISEGGLTIRGGFLRLVYKAFNMFYIGPSGGVLGDGNVQQIMILRRADGTAALQLFDAFPDPDGTLHQALTWFDRAGNAVLADDTDGGQGVARPWLPFVAFPAINLNWPAVTSTSFVTAHRAKGPKQQPKLMVEVWGWNDTAGATGEIQVLVNNVPLGAAQATSNTVVTGLIFGPAVVAGAHMSTLTIEVQARRVAGTGSVQVGMQRIEGRQT